MNCYLDSALGHMARVCNGGRRCTIHPADFHLQTDACPGTQRYLEAHYKCLPQKGEITF